jgi:hypothetical protein
LSTSGPDQLAIESRRWLRLAKDDLAGARVLVERDDVAPHLACYLAQQAAEKAIKARLTRRGVDSDIDLLVVFRTPVEHRATAVALRLAIADMSAPVDFLVTDLDEIERRRSEGAAFRQEVRDTLREGIVVFNRTKGAAPAAGETCGC